MGLGAAHLRLAEEAYGRVVIMAIRRSMYPSLMCSHEPNQHIFNVDANGAIPEIVKRMLVSSQPRLLDLLPALPAALPRGSIRGILARGQIRIDRLGRGPSLPPRTKPMPTGTIHGTWLCGLERVVATRPCPRLPRP